MVVPVLITNCHVSDHPKTGPEAAQRRTTAIASINVEERPTCRSTHRAKRAKKGFSGGSVERRNSCIETALLNSGFSRGQTRKGGRGSGVRHIKRSFPVV